MSNDILSEQQIEQAIAGIETCERDEIQRHLESLKQIAWRISQIRKACKHPSHRLVLANPGVYETAAEYVCLLCKAVVVKPKGCNHGRQ